VDILAVLIYWAIFVIVFQHVFAQIAQLVERVHGKDEVSGSIPDLGSIKKEESDVTR
jgi:hypothetical protein